MASEVNILDLDIPLVDKIFKYPVIKVFANPLQMSLLNSFVQRAVEEKTAERRFVQTGITVTSENPLQGVIEDMFFGQPIVVSGIGQMDDAYLTRAEEQLLTIRDCVVLWREEGAVDYMDPTQLTAIYDVVDSYLGEIENKKLYEVHYISPPEEDIKSLEGFLGNIKARAEENRTRYHGSEAWNALSSMFFKAIPIPGNTQTEISEGVKDNYSGLMELLS